MVFKIIGAFALLLISTCVFAQEVKQNPPEQMGKRPPGVTFRLAMPIVCNDSDIIHNYLTKQHKQLMVFYGIKESSMATAQVIISTWVNPKTKEFTIIQQSIQGISCIIGTGSDFIIDFKIGETES